MCEDFETAMGIFTRGTAAAMGAVYAYEAYGNIQMEDLYFFLYCDTCPGNDSMFSEGFYDWQVD